MIGRYSITCVYQLCEREETSRRNSRHGGKIAAQLC